MASGSVMQRGSRMSTGSTGSQLSSVTGLLVLGVPKPITSKTEMACSNGPNLKPSNGLRGSSFDFDDMTVSFR